MSNVIQFSSARRPPSNEKDKRRLREVEDAGRDAWGNLQKARKHKVPKKWKLTIPDRIELAKALHIEFEKLKKAYPGLRVGKFAFDAGLSNELTSRDLHKCMLPPADESNAREKQKGGLRATVEKYCLFIEAIQKKTGESIAIIADRVTWATSFHPRQVKNIEESESLLSMLQEAINRIDREYPEMTAQAETLFDIFKQTAKAKVEMRKSGSLLRWPYYDADVPYADESPDEYPQYSPHSRRREDEVDVRYAYWHRDFEGYRDDGRYDYPSSLSHYETITNLPRIYLGLIIDWDADGPYDSTRKISHREYLRKHIGEIVEIRDETTNLARLVYRNPGHGENEHLVTGSLHENQFEEVCHAWLVIYPSPDDRFLVPVIYRPYVEAGVQLIQLSHRNFVKLKDLEFITEGGPIIGLYDKIKELIGFKTGRFEIEEAWKATASDVLQNPVLCAHRENEQHEQAFAHYHDKYWRDGKNGA